MLDARRIRKLRAIAKARMRDVIEKIARETGETPDAVRAAIVKNADAIFTRKPL